MTKEQYQEFIEFTQNLYANRDFYSRGKIIEDIREKVTELEQSSITAVVHAKPEVCPCCFGTGKVEGDYRDEILSCLTCGGSGKLSS